MKVKKVILHAGLHKTASTSIQESLKESADYLNLKGIFYPLINLDDKIYSNHSFMLFSMFSEKPETYHINQKMGYNTKSKVDSLNDYYTSSLIDKIDDSESDVVLLSAEDLSSMSMEGLNRLKCFFLENNDFTIKFEVCFYIRHLSDYLQSVIQQRVKDGGWESLLFHEFKAKKIGRVSEQINKFISVFGRENINLFKFEDSLKVSGGIVGHFFDQVLGVDYKGNGFIRSNRSLSYESYLIHSELNQKEPLYNNGILNDSRSPYDLNFFVNMPGVAFSLGNKFYDRSYIDLFDEFKFLKKEFDVDYSPREVKDVKVMDLWGQDVFDYIDSVFNKLSPFVTKSLINFIRDQAVFYENEDVAKSYELMVFAKKYRPNGDFIKNKVFEYEEKLKSLKV